jgi:hypothetical protein
MYKSKVVRTAISEGSAAAIKLVAIRITSKQLWTRSSMPPTRTMFRPSWLRPFGLGGYWERQPGEEPWTPNEEIEPEIEPEVMPEVPIIPPP